MTDRPNQPQAGDITYSSYLKISDILAAQTPLSEPEQHDEMLFIIIHQIYELWFKQILHEVDHAERNLKNQEPLAFVRAIGRISSIQDVLLAQVQVLETMTPNDFNTFRDRLNPASGFQSFQFRLLEFRLGAKQKRYLKYHDHQPEILALLNEALEAPSIYDHFLSHLRQRGFKIPASAQVSDGPYEANEQVTQALVEIYRHNDEHYVPYLMLEALMDIDEKFLLWRQRHVVMVERMIGTRRGTGGSSGAKYLKTTLDKRFFPELWLARNHLGQSERT